MCLIGLECWYDYVWLLINERCVRLLLLLIIWWNRRQHESGIEEKGFLLDQREYTISVSSALWECTHDEVQYMCV